MSDNTTLDARCSTSSARKLRACRRFLPASRLIGDWVAQVLRTEDRDECLAVVAWLAQHGDRSCLGALLAARWRFARDTEFTATVVATVARIDARQASA